MLRLVVPDHAGSRSQAQRLVSCLPADLTGDEVVLDCSEALVATPSFLDEVVKLTLVENGADRLNIVGASQRAAELLRRSAANRHVEERLGLTTPSSSETSRT